MQPISFSVDMTHCEYLGRAGVCEGKQAARRGVAWPQRPSCVAHIALQRSHSKREVSQLPVVMVKRIITVTAEPLPRRPLDVLRHDIVLAEARTGAR